MARKQIEYALTSRSVTVQLEDVLKELGPKEAIDYEAVGCTSEFLNEEHMLIPAARVVGEGKKLIHPMLAVCKMACNERLGKKQG